MSVDGVVFRLMWFDAPLFVPSMAGQDHGQMDGCSMAKFRQL